MTLAKSFHLPVPRVHRTFVAAVPGFSEGESVTGHFIVMDYIPGPTVEQCWASLESQQRFAVTGQVCDIINKLQSTPLKQSPGPVGRMGDQKFEGPWFTDGGAGPFKTLQDLEDWYNHKIDVCIRFKQASPNTPRFRFYELVLTHQDITPRNLIVDAQGKLWMIDWGIAGLYPPGFEQAALRAQCGRNQEFLGMVLAGLSNRQDSVFAQFSTIQYGLSVAANL
jgi:aminoglycoside phosphotransferase (APT) family kinase protein